MLTTCGLCRRTKTSIRTTEERLADSTEVDRPGVLLRSLAYKFGNYSNSRPGQILRMLGPRRMVSGWARTGRDDFSHGERPPPTFPCAFNKLPPPFHATMGTAAFGATQAYCTRNIIFFWQPPSCFSQWTPSCFTADVVSFFSGKQLFAEEKTVASETTNTMWRVRPSPLQ